MSKESNREELTQSIKTATLNLLAEEIINRNPTITAYVNGIPRYSYTISRSETRPGTFDIRCTDHSTGTSELDSNHDTLRAAIHEMNAIERSWTWPTQNPSQWTT